MNIKQKMIRSAIKRYGRIIPVKGKKTLDQCFNITDSKIVFWFNVPEQTTKIEYRNIKEHSMKKAQTLSKKRRLVITPEKLPEKVKVQTARGIESLRLTNKIDRDVPDYIPDDI